MDEKRLVSYLCISKKRSGENAFNLTISDLLAYQTNAHSTANRVIHINRTSGKNEKNGSRRDKKKNALGVRMEEPLLHNDIYHRLRHTIIALKICINLFSQIT